MALMFLQEITFRLDKRPVKLERFRPHSFDLEFWNIQEFLFFFFCNGFLEKKLIFTETAFCGLLPLRGCTPQCYRVEWLSVTKKSEPTNSTDFDPIFTDLSPFLSRNIVGCSTFVEDSFEWPRMLLGINTWSHEKFSIYHVRLILSPSPMEGEFFIHNEFTLSI